MKISIAIPCYEMGGLGVEVLEYSFYKMRDQTFTSFDVVISDDSSNDEIKSLCLKWKDFLDLHYYKNENEHGGSSNFNNAISKCKGDWIKLLCQDDYLFDENSLANTFYALSQNPKTNWLASAYWHTKDKGTLFNLHLPYTNKLICVINTIGTPSCVTLRNVPDMPLLDTNLTYAYDCEFYHRFIKQYGQPIYLNEPTVVNYLWENSTTSSVSQQLINNENSYILEKLIGDFK